MNECKIVIRVKQPVTKDLTLENSRRVLKERIKVPVKCIDR